MSALRGFDVLSSIITMGGLHLDVALRELCANLEPFAVKKSINTQLPFFNTKAAKGAAMFAKEPWNLTCPF